MQIGRATATNPLQESKLWALVYPGWIRGVSECIQGVSGGLHAMYSGSIWGLSGVSGSLNSKSCEKLVAFGHHVDSSSDTTLATYRIHLNIPSYTNGYTDDTCPDTPWIHTEHAPQLYHSYDILGHFGASSDILTHTAYGIWHMGIPYKACRCICGCIWVYLGFSRGVARGVFGEKTHQGG